MPEWAGVVNTTATKFMKGASDATLRERIIFAMMMRRKRISYNWNGKDVTQQVKFALPEVMAYSGGTIDFEPSDKYRQITLDWRGYKVQDTMTEKERLMNRGVPQLINRYANIMRDMRQALEDEFGTEVWNNGDLNTDRMHGIESFMGYTAAASTDTIARPNDTFGGLSTVLADIAGSWSSDLTTYPSAGLATDWPSGKGGPEYDFNSPRLLNVATTNWGTGSTSWIDNCERLIRRGQLWTRLTSGRNGKPDLCLLADDYYADYLNKQEAKQRIIVPHKEVQDLGFEGVKQEGVSVTTEFGMTASTGYLLNIDKMHMRCLDGQLFVPRGPEYDIRTDSYLFLLGWFGNMFWEPKFFSKIGDLT